MSPVREEELVFAGEEGLVGASFLGCATELCGVLVKAMSAWGIFKVMLLRQVTFRLENSFSLRLAFRRRRHLLWRL